MTSLFDVTTFLPASSAASMNFLRGGLAADHLDDRVDLGISENRVDVGTEHAVREADAAVGRHVEVDDALEPHRASRALFEHFAILQQYFRHAGTDGTESDHSDDNVRHSVLLILVAY